MNSINFIRRRINLERSPKDVLSSNSRGKTKLKLKRMTEFVDKRLQGVGIFIFEIQSFTKRHVRL